MAKFEATAGALSLALKTVMRAKPLFNYVRIENGRLLAAHGNMFCVAAEVATTRRSFRGVLDGLLLARVVGAIPPLEMVTIEDKRDGVTLSWARGRYPLANATVEVTAGETLVLNHHERAAVGAGFSKALQDLLPFVSAEEFRVGLCGVHVEGDCRDGASFVATNGHTLAALPCNHAFGENFTIPTEVAGLLARWGVTALSKVGQNTWRAHCLAGVSVVFETIDASYPDWRRVVPETYEGLVRVGRTDWEGAAKRLLAARTNGCLSVVTLSAHDGRVALASGVATKKYCVEDLAASECVGPVPVTSFNPKLSATVMRFVGGERVTVELSPKSGPVRVKREGGGFALLMPMVTPHSFQVGDVHDVLRTIKAAPAEAVIA